MTSRPAADQEGDDRSAGPDGSVAGRTHRNVGQSVLCAVVGGAWVVGLVAFAAAAPTIGPAIALGVLALVGGFVFARAARMRLVVDDAGITVAGLSRTGHVAWDDVVGVVASPDGVRVLAVDGRSPILHSISEKRHRRGGGPGRAEVLADLLTDEARRRQST